MTKRICFFLQNKSLCCGKPRLVVEKMLYWAVQGVEGRYQGHFGVFLKFFEIFSVFNIFFLICLWGYDILNSTFA
ncbi:MAG: hypothetical protein JSV99_02535 [Planctomycetota bacterium]|nr:MAG: hypothetical protein JSV99_02535 [Planctomycetota bacterium]